MKRINFMLPEQMLASLGKVAEATGLSLSEIIRTAIAEYLNKKCEVHN